MTNIIKFPAEKMRDSQRAISHTRPYLEHLYAHFALNGCKYQWFDGDHEITKHVQLMGADASLICKQTSNLKYVDEKTDFHEPRNFCLETISNTVTNPMVPGWMRTSKADRLVYSFVWLEGILDVFIVDFTQLHRWFWSNDNYHKVGKLYTVPNSPNKTQSYLVPVTRVTEHVSTYRYLITSLGDMFSVPLSGQNPINIVPRVLNKHGLPFRKLTRAEGITA